MPDELELIDAYWRAANYLSARELGEDLPEVRLWTWPGAPPAPTGRADDVS